MDIKQSHKSQPKKNNLKFSQHKDEDYRPNSSSHDSPPNSIYQRQHTSLRDKPANRLSATTESEEVKKSLAKLIAQQLLNKSGTDGLQSAGKAADVDIQNLGSVLDDPNTMSNLLNTLSGSRDIDLRQKQPNSKSGQSSNGRHDS